MNFYIFFYHFEILENYYFQTNAAKKSIGSNHLFSVHQPIRKNFKKHHIFPYKLM